VTSAGFAFGAAIFASLTFEYAREWRKRKSNSRVFPIFTLFCAVAFVCSLLLEVTDGFGAILETARNFATGLLPALMLHATLEAEAERLPRPSVWRAGVLALYAAALAAAIAPAGEWTQNAPAAIFGVAAVGALAATLISRRRPWIAVVFALMAACAAASLTGWGALLGPAPDYLILAFFAVTLYDRERLMFFDVLVKRGAFLALGIAAATAMNNWMFGAAFWIAGSWVYPRLSRAVDHRWLRRPYTAADAERQFLRGLHGAADEAELVARAEESLGAIFRAPARVRFDDEAAAPEDGLAAGPIVLDPRPDGIPFLSDDRRLVQSLAGGLAVVLENVRFRAREQQLRLLATRAELKALRAQINPHFLFNSLSVIAGLIQYQPELADETIEQLAQVFRYTLRKSENEWAPLAEEVEFAAAYLRVEQARFGGRLETEFSVAPDAAAVAVPAMCVQTLIENAVKHGVAAVPGPGRVSLCASVSGGELRIEVADSGPGFPPNFSLSGNGEGHGLRNVAERLRGYYGDAARLAWDRGPQGTCVTIALPRVRSAAA
jgi:two-component sensor histidine kinase